MYCASVDEAFKQISEYFTGDTIGYPLVLDTENIGIYSEILQRLEADRTKECKFVSSSCRKNELPNIDFCISEISETGDYVLIGSSQALMLKSEKDLENHVGMILGQSIRGHALVILSYCRQYIEMYENRDPRISRRTLLVEGMESPLPKIALMSIEASDVDFMMHGINRLLVYLEKLNEAKVNEKKVIPVKTRFKKEFFSQALYQVVEADGVYEALVKRYSDIAGATEKSYGTEEQWKWLDEKMKKAKSLSAVIVEEFGTFSNLEYIIGDIDFHKETQRCWLFWLALKAYGTGNKYLQRVLCSSSNIKDFIECIYLELAKVSIADKDFENMFDERKVLLDRIPERLPLIAKYCEKIGKYEKNAIYYLTDRSENEEFEFMRYLSTYDYDESELCVATKHFSPMLEIYMQQFVFDKANTKVADSDSELRDVLSQYFQEYKIQKITNRIYPYFLDMIREFATERPYNKLRPRSNIVSQMDKKGAELFFFDALGVEFLSFIKAKCEEYGLIVEISVGRCELPSITEKNKEFIHYFDGKYKKIDALDKLKHHSQIYDYEKRKEPVHIFRELEIIDVELRRIQSLLVQGVFKKAIIVSDHGASRLAVISGLENDSVLELEEKGQHSGRCCPVEVDPNIPYAAFEDGFAILANYERFKGGRKANVEVHGGATLEEVVVPVITLSRKPENVEYCFTNPSILLKKKDVATLTLYCNVPMIKPRILVDGKFYEGVFEADQKHAKFVMPKLKRSREYVAELYEGDISLSISLPFKIQTSMGQEVDLFS